MKDFYFSLEFADGEPPWNLRGAAFFEYRGMALDARELIFCEGEPLIFSAREARLIEREIPEVIREFDPELNPKIRRHWVN